LKITESGELPSRRGTGQDKGREMRRLERSWRKIVWVSWDNSSEGKKIPGIH